MIYLLAIFLPWLAVMLQKRFGVRLLLFFLQITLLGWFPAIWIAFSVIKKMNRQKKIEVAIKKALIQKSRFYRFWAKNPEKASSSSQNQKP